MALPDYLKDELGTPVVWGEAGGSGVTKTLSVNGLASTVARQGASADLHGTNGWDDEFLLEVRVEVGTAPTAGLTFEVYLAWSSDNTNWPSVVTGSDGVYTLTGATVAQIKQTLGPPAIVLVADGGTGTNRVQAQNVVIARAASRYVAPVVVNLLGQAVRSQGTASANLTRVIITPMLTQVTDTTP